MHGKDLMVVQQQQTLAASRRNLYKYCDGFLRVSCVFELEPLRCAHLCQLPGFIYNQCWKHWVLVELDTRLDVECFCTSVFCFMNLINKLGRDGGPSGDLTLMRGR